MIDIADLRRRRKARAERHDRIYQRARRGVILMGVAVVLAMVLAILTGCTVGPIATEKGVSLGGTLMTKNKGYYARYKGPLGEMETGSAENDETVIPGKLINYYGIKAATDGAVSLMRTREETARLVERETTKRAGIQTGGEVEKLRILNPAPEAVVEAVPVP